MIVLGLFQTGRHDASAALLIDGRIVACVEQERLSRRKHALNEAATDAARLCLEIGGLSIHDVDVCALPNSYSNVKRLRLASFQRSLGRRGGKAWNFLWRGGKKKERRRIKEAHQTLAALSTGAGQLPRVVSVEHHLSHAASSFFFSGWESAALLTIDGEGECTTTLFGEADRTRGVWATHEIPRPDSLGLFYSTMTEFLGFRSLNGEFKVMGMAPYGDPAKADLSGLVTYKDGDYRLDLDLVHVRRFMRFEGTKLFSSALVDRLGPPRTGDGLSEPYTHIAAATQKVLEDTTLHLLEHHLTDALERHEGRLCFAGGCALNVRLNRILLEHPLVKQLWVQPAAHDGGLSLGCAAIVAHGAGDRIESMTHVAHGPEYSQAEIEGALEASGLAWRTIDDPADVAARLLHEEHVVSWFQGRMEWGPRALGNRSILGNPAVKGTADRINSQIKFREGWRPFCPSILEEHAHDVCETDHPSPFMTFTFRVRDAWKERIPEIVHIDGTARPQFVSKTASPLYHEMISRFHAMSGVPVVINTSLNRRGEPMVCSPQDAIAMFEGSGLTHMVMGNTLTVKDMADLG